MDAAVIRTERSTDRAAVDDLHRAAFGLHGEKVVALTAALREAPPPTLSIVMEQQGAIIGHLMLSGCLVDATASLVPALVLSPLSVRPGRQGEGLGTRLVRWALDLADEGGATMVVLEGPPAFYSRLGFGPAHELELRRPSLRIPLDALQVRILSAYRPWMTGTVVYPELWWRLDAVGLRDGTTGDAHDRDAAAHPDAS